jgi:hypothetical protein
MRGIDAITICHLSWRDRNNGELVSDQRGGETKSSVVFNGALNVRGRHARGNSKKMTPHDPETLHGYMWHKTNPGIFGAGATKANEALQYLGGCNECPNW